MKSVILCEGQDDLWFLAYYLNKIDEWDITKERNWKGTKISFDKKAQNVIYMQKNRNNVLAIKSVGGERNLQHSMQEILEDNEWIDDNNALNAVVLFRDCDDREQEELARSMEQWFENTITLNNNQITDYLVSEEFERTLKILPLVIPFDEQGAIETLLLKAISDFGDDGSYVAEHSRDYVKTTKLNVKSYLKKQRDFTKAQFAAAMAIIDPTRSRDAFNQLMYAIPWEKSATLHKHMQNAVKLISGQL